MPFKHFISTSQFTRRSELEKLFDAATDFERRDAKNTLPSPLRGKIIASLFYEPSTRTRFSFEAAVQKLGGGIITAENALGSSSAAKGETLHDAIKIVSGYADGIVLRHFEEGSAKIAASVSPVPVINAGDGAGEHPSQALLDVYTIKKELGRIDDFSIALIGDLLYGRTIHSLFPLFALCKKVRLILVSPPGLRLPEKYAIGLKEKGMTVAVTGKLDPVLSRVDVLYITRIQKERFRSEREYAKTRNSYIIDTKAVSKLKRSAIIMHPLPRVNEIAPEVDADVRAAYFRQAKNGLYARMALLQYLIR